MKKKTSLIELIVLIIFLAFVMKVVIWAILPGYALYRNQEEFWDFGYVHAKPFWPRYWRRLRNIPEPSDPEEINHSDDGGIIFLAIIATPIALGLAYRFKRHLIRRV